MNKMVKRIFKTIGKLLLVFILLIGLLYAGFHLWEYATGGKYIKYLTENGETIPLEDDFDFDNLKDDIERSELILFGEIHGFKEPIKFDVDFFKYLNKNHGVNHYLVEFDFVQATMLNEFLLTGDDKVLDKVLKKWVVFQGRNNLDYRNKFVDLYKYYQELPLENKFEFVGVDRIQDESLLREYVNRFSPKSKDSEASNSVEESSLLEKLSSIETSNKDTLFIVAQLKSNIKYWEDRANRDDVMFENFQSIYKEKNLKTKKIYGLLGFGHIFLYRVNGGHVFASQVRKSELGLQDKIMCINTMMNESQMVMLSNQLPEFMRDEGKYTRMEISSDNMLFIYMVGVKDFKRMTPKYHKSLIKMNGENSPYGNNMRLNKTIQLLPVTPKIEITDKGKAYFTHTLFIRNSDWAAPIE